MYDETRRTVLRSGLALIGTAMLGPALPAMARVETLGRREPAAALKAPAGIAPELFNAALEALQRHGDAVPHHDRIAIADFSAPSWKQRFHLVDLKSARSETLYVAHGSGSDPKHSGWLRNFSNQAGSNASCEGAFLTSNYYSGKHDRSQRLVGLDPTNCNALDRAIVIHGAWYANPDMIEKHGKLGRSQGCFTVAERDLDQVFDHLGEGRMLFAAKL